MDNQGQIQRDPPAASHHITDAKQMDLYLEQLVMTGLEYLCVPGADNAWLLLPPHDFWG